MLQDRFLVNSFIVSIIAHILGLIVFSVINFSASEIRQVVPVSLINIEGSIPATPPKQAPPKERPPVEKPVKEVVQKPPPEAIKEEPVAVKEEVKPLEIPKPVETAKVEKIELPKELPPEKVDLSNAVILKPEEVDLKREVVKVEKPTHSAYVLQYLKESKK